MEFQAVGFAEHKEKKKKKPSLPRMRIKIPFVRDIMPYYAYYLGTPLMPSFYRYSTRQFRIMLGISILFLIGMRLFMIS